MLRSRSLDSGESKLLHRVLDHGLVDDRNQVFGNGLAGGQESSPQPGSRYNRFTN